MAPRFPSDVGHGAMRARLESPRVRYATPGFRAGTTRAPRRRQLPTKRCHAALLCGVVRAYQPDSSSKPLHRQPWSASSGNRSGPPEKCPDLDIDEEIEGAVTNRLTAGPSISATWGAISGPPISLEKLQHQAIHLRRVLVGGPVAGVRNPVHVEYADGLADLADQELGGAEGRIVALAPEQADATPESREVAEERPAGADLAAVEAGATDTGGLDVHRLLGDARRVAQHVDEQVVAADLAEQRLVVAGLLVAADRPLAEAARRKAAGRDEAQVRHARPQPQGEVRGDGAAEREAGEAQRRRAREHLDDERVHEVEIGGAGRLAGNGRGITVRGMIERVHGEARGQRLDVADPVLPRAHAAVEEDEVRSAAAAVDGHPGSAVAQEARGTRVSSSRSRAATITSSPGWRLIGSTAISST